MWDSEAGSREPNLPGYSFRTLGTKRDEYPTPWAPEVEQRGRTFCAFDVPLPCLEKHGILLDSAEPLSVTTVGEELIIAGAKDTAVRT
jgi:hypothetical protein